MAIARCRWKLEGHVTTAEAPLPARNGVLQNVLRQEGGRWFIVDAQNTDIIEGDLSRPQYRQSWCGRNRPKTPNLSFQSTAYGGG